MTRKRRLKRRSRRTQRGVQRKSNRRTSHRGGGAQKPPVTDICKGLPYPVNGLQYTTKTEEIIKNQQQADYKSFFDSTCKSPYYVSTSHGNYSVKGKFMIIKNPEKVVGVVDKWIALLQPISAKVVGTSKLEIATRANVNPFATYYQQLQTYKALFDNKSMMSTGSASSLISGIATAASTLGKSVDSEALYSDDNIMETFRGIDTQYKYYNDMPFNMKEFLGFEGIGGWLGTEASRKKSMEAVDSEVAKLASQKEYDTAEESTRKGTKKELMETEQTTKIAASKAALVLCLYVFCYVNYMPIPKGNMDEDTINRMIQTLNKFYEQINTFSVGGTPKEVNLLLDKYAKDFTTNLGQLKKEMEKKTAVKKAAAKTVAKDAAKASAKKTEPEVENTIGDRVQNISSNPLLGGPSATLDGTESLPSTQVQSGENLTTQNAKTGMNSKAVSNTWNRLQAENKNKNSRPSIMRKASNNSKTEELLKADSKTTEEKAKQYFPQMPPIPVEKQSGDYKIAQEKLKKAIETYGEDQTNIHAQIVSAEYQKLLDIAKNDLENAKKDKNFPEKVKEKEDIVFALQKDSKQWIGNKGERKDSTSFDPDKVDAKIVGLKISSNQLDKEIEVVKSKLGKTKEDNVFDGLTNAIEKEGDAILKVNTTKSKLEVAKETLKVKNLKEDENTNEGKEWKKAKDEYDKAEIELNGTDQSPSAAKTVEDAVAQLKQEIPSKNEIIDELVKLLKEKAQKKGEITMLERSSELQRGFLSDKLSYEKTIAYLYRPKDNMDPLQKFYDAIKEIKEKDTVEIEKFYNMIQDPNLLDGNENVSEQDLKTFVQANEKENKMRARTHFFMKVLYTFAKDLQKMIKHATVTGFGTNVHVPDLSKSKKDRLKEMKEYLKERARSETLFSLYPIKDLTVSDAIDPGVKDTHKFVRLYNSDEYKQVNSMFSLKETPLEHVFDNTAYFKDRGFVFIKDPAKYMGMFVKYYYDEDDYVNGEELLKPKFEEKEETKEAAKAYRELGEETTTDKVVKTLKEMNYAGTGTSAQIVKETITFQTNEDTGLKSTKTTGKAIVETGKSIVKTGNAIKGVFVENKEKSAQELAKKQENALRKQQIMNVSQKGGFVKGAGQVLGGITGFVAGVISVVWFPISLVLNVIINACKITLYPFGKAAYILFDQTKLLDSSSYKSLGNMAKTKEAECKKIVEMLAMNCEQEKDQRCNQLLLSVLSNIYNAVDYIQKAEEKFRDRHEYKINKFTPYIENLVAIIKKDPVAFGEQSLYKSMNDSKKMLYFVYSILQKCEPKTLADVKNEKVAGIENKDGELTTKINNLKTKRTALETEITTLKSATPATPPTQIPNPAIAEKEKKKEELDKEIEGLELKEEKEKKAKQVKEQTEDLDKEIGEEQKTAAETLSKNEKPVKELLKKNPPIKFDMTDVSKMFENPKTYLYTRYAGIKTGQEMLKTVTLIPDVNMLVPSQLPAVASVFVYRTGEKDEKQLEKEALAKEAADKKEAKAKETADRKSKEAIAKTGAKAAIQAAKIAAKAQLKTTLVQMPGQYSQRAPNRARATDRPQETETKPSIVGRITKKIKNTAKNVTNRVRNVTSGTVRTLADLIGRQKPQQVCVNEHGRDKCFEVKMYKGRLMIQVKPR